MCSMLMVTFIFFLLIILFVDVCSSCTAEDSVELVEVLDLAVVVHAVPVRPIFTCMYCCGMLERCFVEVDFCSAAGSNDILACCFCNTIGELTFIAVVGRQVDEYNVIDLREVVGKERREACFIGHVGLDGTCITLVIDASALYVVLQQVKTVVALDEDVAKLWEAVLDVVGIGGEEYVSAFRVLDEPPEGLCGIMLHGERNDPEGAYPQFREGLDALRTACRRQMEILACAGGHIDGYVSVDEVLGIFCVVAMLMRDAAAYDVVYLEVDSLLHFVEPDASLNGKHLSSCGLKKVAIAA